MFGHLVWDIRTQGAVAAHGTQPIGDPGDKAFSELAGKAIVAMAAALCDTAGIAPQSEQGHQVLSMTSDTVAALLTSGEGFNGLGIEANDAKGRTFTFELRMTLMLDRKPVEKFRRVAKFVGLGR